MEDKWEPILPSAMREQAVDLVNAIASDVLFYNPPRLMWEGGLAWEGEKSRAQVIRKASLANGMIGFSVLFGYLADAGIYEGAKEISAAYLNTALAAAEAVPLPMSLYSGVAGIGATLSQSLLKTAKVDDLGLAAAADTVATAVRTDRSSATHFDLITGVAGCGVFGLDMLSWGERALVAAVAEWLTARMDDRAVGTWYTTPELSFLGKDRKAGLPRGTRQRGGSAGYFDLGVAHGIPGVLAVLDDIVTAMLGLETMRPMIDAGLEWLFSQRLPGDQKSAFPWARDPEAQPRPARAAWCYGDPGIAAVLYRVCARNARHQARCQQLADIAAWALAREPSHAGVYDAGLCHGAAGLGHIANRLLWSTGEERFRRLAHRWFDWVLRYRRPEAPFGGVVSWQGEKYVPDPGFLTGATGVALALVAALTPATPDWDRFLLLSAAPKSWRSSSATC